MTLSIKDDLVSKEARELARETGETITQAVGNAIHEQLKRVKMKRNADRTFKKLEAIRLRVANLPDLNHGTPDEILGYDEAGLPT